MMAQLPVPVPVQSAGFPTNYPYATSSPLPSAILRPLQNPLYDADVLLAVATQTTMQFFQRGVGQNNSVVVVKTLADTNLQQSGQLANPLEFSVFAFNFVVAPSVTQADWNAIMIASVFTFLYTGNRVYLQVPLNRIPCGVGQEGWAATAVGGAPLTIQAIKNGVGHISNVYKFTIGRAALRIRPTENFQITVQWPTVAPTIVGVGQPGAPAVLGVRLQAFIVGLTWQPL